RRRRPGRTRVIGRGGQSAGRRRLLGQGAQHRHRFGRRLLPGNQPAAAARVSRRKERHPGREVDPGTGAPASAGPRLTQMIEEVHLNALPPSARLVARQPWHDIDTGLSPERLLAEEMPVAASYDGTTHAVLMMTPDSLEDFAVGFSLTEGIIR